MIGNIIVSGVIMGKIIGKIIVTTGKIIGNK